MAKTWTNSGTFSFFLHVLFIYVIPISVFMKFHSELVGKKRKGLHEGICLILCHRKIWLRIKPPAEAAGYIDMNFVHEILVPITWGDIL